MNRAVLPVVQSVHIFLHFPLTKIVRLNTFPARKLMEQEGVLWSTWEDLDALLELNGLRTLPDLDADANE